MSTIQHNTLAGAEIHEPKGVATAVAGQQYIADGLGSGNWEHPGGWAQYQDSRTTVGAPAQTIATGVRTPFVSNGGFLTEESYAPDDAVSSMWNISTNKMVPIKAFDTYDLRVSFTAENYSGANPFMTMDLDIGGGIGIIVSQTIPLLKSGAAQDFVWTFPVFTGATFLANGGTVNLTYTGTGSCDIYKNSVLLVRTSRNG